MRGKEKLLLIFALILVWNLNVGAAQDNFDEEGVLNESRIKRLEKIAEIDNSTGMPRGAVYQSDAIKFEEYKFLEGNVEKYKNLFKIFKEAFGRLVIKVAEFAELNLKNNKFPLHEAEFITNELKKYDEIVKNYKNNFTTNTEYKELIKIVINSKTFMMDLHSKGSEGSLLDIYSFMEKASSLNYKESLFNVTAIKSLKIIFNLSKIQSEEMDKAIIEAIYNKHLENKKN